MRNRKRRTPGGWRAVLYALLVHLAVAAVLVVGFRWSGPDAVVTGEPIQAVVVEDPRKQKLEEERRRAEEQRRREEEARKQAEAERQRQEAEARKRREEEERQRAEEQRRQEQERLRAEAEQRRQAEIKRKLEEEARKKREEEERRQAAEAERKRREEEERRRKAAEEQLQQQLAAEERARAEAARAARAASEAEKYRALIRQKVSRNWNRPAGTAAGMSCTVRVRLVPGGDVLQATVVRSSGNPLFDRSVEAAVHKASPLPIPSDPDLFEYFRDLEFVFRPEE